MRAHAPFSFVQVTAVLLVLLLALLTVPPKASAEQLRAPASPLVSQNTHPFYTALQQWLPRPAPLTPPGSVELALAQSYANYYLYLPTDAGDPAITADIDGEAWYVRFSSRWGIAEGWELGAAARTLLHYGGVLDPLISRYHALLGFPNGGRELEASGRLRFYLENGAGIIIDSSELFFGFGALELELRRRLLSGDNGFSMSAGAAVELPTLPGSHPLSASGLDAALRLYTSLDRGRWVLHGSLGAALLSRPRFLPEAYFSPWCLPYDLSGIWRAGADWSLALTVSGSSSPFATGYSRTDRHSSTVSFGLLYATGEASQLQLSMSQEFFTFAASDVAINLFWQRRYAPR